MGAISPGRWQLAQFLYKIGATSLEKVGIPSATAGMERIALQTDSTAIFMVAVCTRRFIRVSLALVLNFTAISNGLHAMPFQVSLLHQDPENTTHIISFISPDG
jgi:hypothetical protein